MEISTETATRSTSMASRRTDRGLRVAAMGLRESRAGVNVSQDVWLDYEINVGNRLLIFLVAVDDSGSLEPLISQLVREGTDKRDRDNFNRFRLVLLTQKPTDMAEDALAVFRSLGADEKVHLHVVGKDDFST